MTEYEQQETPEAETQASPMDFILAVTQSDNISDQIDELVLKDMARQARDDYNTDKDSMSDWFTKAEQGIEFAQLTKGDKNYPFEGASNIKYPLITTAALHYNAKAYPAIVPSGNPVAAKVNGSDPSGQKAARGERTSNYTSHQLRKEIPNWERDMDRLLFIGPIVGTMHKKIWFDPAKDANVSQLCDVGSIIINHGSKTIEQAPCITEELGLYQHEISTRIRSGTWQDVEDDLALDPDDKTKPVEFLEHHMRFDLDEDGYAEPYIVTMHKDSSTIVRVVANFTMDTVMLSENGDTVLSIDPTSYFVDYHFMPAFDGGYWGDGFGVLLSDNSEAINSTLNMIMDAGHFQAMPSGFIAGKDMRIKPGVSRFSPGEWKTINAHGNDVRAGMVELSMPEPSPVLFQMLGLLIDMGRDVGSAKDIAPEQAAQMTATTTMAIIDQGLQVFNASYKRVYLAQTREFEMLYTLNEKYLSPEKYSAFFDDVGEDGQPIMFDPQKEFSSADMDITPVADPKSVTDMQKLSRAQFLLELANTGMVDTQEAGRRILEAGHFEGIDKLIPQATQQDQMLLEMQTLDAQLSLKLKAAEIDVKLAKARKDTADAESVEDAAYMNEYINALNATKSEIEIHQQKMQPAPMKEVPKLQ